MARTHGANVTDQIHVEHVVNADNDDFHAALELYHQRIPHSEQFEIPDIVRWIREGSEQVEGSHLRNRDFCLIAKQNDDVCGMMIFHYFPKHRLVFIGYLVSASEYSATTPREAVASKLLAKFKTFLKESLKDCEGILLEVDQPLTATTPRELTKRLARIRLFCVLANSLGFYLRAFDMDYRQPPLSLGQLDDNVPMLLMFTDPRTSAAASKMNASLVRKLLKFVYTEMYPDRYSDNDDENRRYARALKRFSATRLKTIRRQVPLLDFRQIRLQATKASEASPHKQVFSERPEVTSGEGKKESIPKNRSSSLADLRVGSYWDKVWKLTESNFFMGGGIGGVLAALAFLGPAPRFAIGLLCLTWVVISLSICRHRFFEHRSMRLQILCNVLICLIVALCLVAAWLFLAPSPAN
ncbi:MAG TPA: hypothetical protein VJT15_12305 [Pyrinomonadaceae bacterium]|nr:hypothetical protein [Pyrinomonadaceae bacterium]